MNQTQPRNGGTTKRKIVRTAASWGLILAGAAAAVLFALNQLGSNLATTFDKVGAQLQTAKPASTDEGASR